MKSNFYSLFSALFLLSGFTLNAQTYNEHDLSKLKAFVEQTADGVRNIDLLWDEAPEKLAEDGSNWVSGLKEYLWWSDDRLVEIDAMYKNLTGIVDFEGCTKLSMVSLRNNNFTEANLKGCTNLKAIYLCVNKITSINIEGCDNIQRFSANTNEFTTLDVANKAKLTHLYITYNKLASLDVTGCYSLKELAFTKRGTLTSIDLSDCSELTLLECQGNQLTSLDLSKNPKIKKLILTQSGFTNPLTALNISGCKQLESYDFISLLPDLKTLNISNCGLSSIDLSENTKLTKLEAGGQQLQVEKQETDNSELKLEVLPIDAILVTPSDEGVFENGVITWSNLPVGEGAYSYNFTTTLPAGATGTPFGGTVSVPWSNHDTPVSNVEVENNPIVIYAANGAVYVRAETPQAVRVFNLMGQLVKQATAVTEASFYLPKGIYILQIGNQMIRKVIVK